MENESKQINYTFRLLYAIGMILIVSGHCQGGGVSLFYEWFPPYGFHLGLFAFASGYFFKDENEKSLGRFLLKKIKRLLIPLYLWNIFYALLVWLLARFGFSIGMPVTWDKIFVMPITNGHQFMYNMGGWFVIPLFMVEMVSAIGRGIVHKISADFPEWIFFAMSLAAGILGCTLAICGYRTGWWLVLVRMLYFIPFYGLGILYKRSLERQDRLPSVVYFAICMAVALVVISIYGKPLIYTPSWCNDFYQGPVMPYIVGFTGIAFWLRIARILSPVIGRSRPVNLIATSSYSIMINQFFGFMVVKTIFALLYKFTPLCQNFSMPDYKASLLYYMYVPGPDQWKILYLAAGILVPIVMQKIVDRVKHLLKTLPLRHPAVSAL